MENNKFLLEEQTNIIEGQVNQSIIANTFLYTGLYTFITFALGYFVTYLIKTGAFAMGTYFIMSIIFFIIGLGIIFYTSSNYNNLSYEKLIIAGILFSALEGFGIAGILSYYNSGSVIMAFMSASILFLLMAFIGYTTKTDLSKMGTLLLIGLLGIIIVSLLNVFLFHSGTLGIIVSILSIIIFLGLTAYDLQILKQASITNDKKIEPYFGLSLYLNFINLFIELLHLFGNDN